jgi:hypothetical protein
MSLKGRSCWVVNIRMDDAEKLSLEAIGRFVVASEDLRFETAAISDTDAARRLQQAKAKLFERWRLTA